MFAYLHGLWKEAILSEGFFSNCLKFQFKLGTLDKIPVWALFVPVWLKLAMKVRRAGQTAHWQEVWETRLKLITIREYVYLM